MSPRVDSSTTLPCPQRRSSDPLYRMIAEALDHQLLCHAEADTSFTIPEVRDQLLKFPELEGIDPTQLRYRVRDRLRTLETHQLVREIGVRGKNRPLYRMQLDGTAHQDAGSASSATPNDAGDASSTPPDSLITHLEQERHRLQTAMQVAISEAEHYKRLITEFPDARRQISPLLESAIERSGRLQGQWDANVKVRQTLESMVFPTGKAVEEGHS